MNMPFSEAGLEESSRLEAELRRKELGRVFSDTLDKHTSRAAMRVVYYGEAGVIRIEIGVPYSIVGAHLIIGPYVKEPRSAPPADYEARKKEIPLANIVTFDRIDLTLNLLTLASREEH